MDLQFNMNEDQLKQLCSQLNHKEKITRLGGGEKKIADQHKKGKLTAKQEEALENIIKKLKISKEDG